MGFSSKGLTFALASSNIDMLKADALDGVTLLRPVARLSGDAAPGSIIESMKSYADFSTSPTANEARIGPMAKPPGVFL